MTEHPPPTLHILEGGFRVRPEQVAAYAKRHEEFMPYVIKQPGFRETYGGPIPRSPWWFFTAKFDTLEDMEQWQKDREHVDVQDSARATWWTGYYIRKGRLLAPGESVTGQILSEIMICRDTELSQDERTHIHTALSKLAEAGIRPYETVWSERTALPYVFTQLAGIAPQRAPQHYVLLSYWHGTTDCQSWQESAEYRHLTDLGTIRSTCFQIIPERQRRMGLRPDRMQREWLAEE